MGKALNFLLQDFDAVAAPQHTDIHMDGPMMLDLNITSMGPLPYFLERA